VVALQQLDSYAFSAKWALARGHIDFLIMENVGDANGLYVVTRLQSIA